MPPTHRDVFASFARHEVRYVLIGGAAVIIYGVPRMTFDVDVLIEATPENAAAVLAALREAGLGTAWDIEPDELLAQEIVIFKDILAVDVHTRTPGVSFDEAWERRRMEMVEGVPVSLAGIDDLIASKEAADRDVDREDVAILRRLYPEQA